MCGKGSKPRPTNKAKYERNYDNINWKKKDRNHDKPLPTLQNTDSKSSMHRDPDRLGT